MKNFLAKIWVPTVLVMIAAMQSFGIDATRAISMRRVSDSLSTSKMLSDSTIISLHDSIIMLDLDSARKDSIIIDTIDTVKVIKARDTIVIPDSLKEKDPFFYKYYIAVKDSLTRVQVRESLILAGDSLELAKLDSLYIKDSTEVAVARFNAWYNSLSKRERKKYDAEQALPGLIAAAMRKQEIKDSIKARRDSIIEATPRILETFAFPDSMQYKRIVTWQLDRNFNDLVNLREQDSDTSFNYNFYDYSFMKKDVNATWLGVAGSPVQLYDFFKREEERNVVFFTPLREYSYSPETLPMFNTKTPYTELAYWGTLFANQEKEETNVKVLTTQNITPELNLTLIYNRFGGNGMLRREDHSNRTFVAATNYVGKKYMMHAGYIWNKIHNSDNGGIQDLFWIRDTTVDSREIEVYLKEAESERKKQTVFLDQSYRIPFTFIEDLKGLKERKRKEAVRDSILASGDSTAIAALKASEEAELAAEAENKDTTSVTKDITTAFIGHSSEYSVFSKSYTDKIEKSDTPGREFFNNRFFLNPTQSNDSLRVMRLDNRVFIRLQPWSADAIVSKLDVGVGDKLLNYYSFSPKSYLTGPETVAQNSVYLYAGAQGQHEKYLKWNAFGDYTFAGHELNDFSIKGNLAFSMYPFRKDRHSPLTIGAHFETSLREPDYYQQHLYTNHYMWNNNFGKISTTKIEGTLDIPRWKTSLKVGYALLSNNIYYDTEGIVRQNQTPMSILTASLRQDFKAGWFHFDHQALMQFSSNNDVLPLPMLALNFRYYVEFNVVRNVMRMQIGANALYTTKWHAPAYNPVLGVFHNQNTELYGDCPYIDAFVNVQWKQASVFIKYVNANMGWPCKSADYFTAHGRIATQSAIKFGISWPFWIFPGKNGSSGGSKAGAASGGGSRGASLPAGGGRGGMKSARGQMIRQ